MPKILILSQFLNTGGLERLVLSLSRELKQNASWIPVVYSYDEIPGQPTLAQELTSLGIEVKQFKKRQGFSFQLVRSLWSFVRSEQIKVVHSHDLGPWIYAVLLKIALLGRVRLIHTQHSRVYLQGSWKNEIYEWVCLKFTDHVVLVSENVGMGATSYKSAQHKISVIENGVKFPDFSLLGRDEKVQLRKEILAALPVAIRLNLDPLVENYWILCLGRIHPGKGQENVLNVWKNLSNSARKKAVLLFVGPETVEGRLHYLKTLCNALPECNHVFFLGATTVPEKWILSSHIFTSGSEYEGMPLAPIEASGAGLPVLLSDIEGHVRLQSLPTSSTQFFPIAQPEVAAQWLEQQIVEVSKDELSYYQRVWSDTALVRAQCGLSKMIHSYTALYEVSMR